MNRTSTYSAARGAQPAVEGQDPYRGRNGRKTPLIPRARAPGRPTVSLLGGTHHPALTPPLGRLPMAPAIVFWNSKAFCVVGLRICFFNDNLNAHVSRKPARRLVVRVKPKLRCC